MAQVPDRSLLVGFDVVRPIRLIDCDIFLGDEPLEIDISIGNSSIEIDLAVESKEIELDAIVITEPIEIELFVGFGECYHDYYNGAYLVIPQFIDQELETEEKLMKRDVTVKEIPVSRTSNPSGGITVTIG